VRSAAGPVPVARGGNDLAVLADREGRRGNSLDAAFVDVTGVGGQHELPEARIIQGRWRGGRVTGPGAELRRSR